ncbi:uncharacterized protein BYT42DRAFT_621730 [Radiomyces spectabilis]|uniref:uncharacterized protein n=1 Tax=Radiomyces spectabilis TaxID=64574 RepID=UPI0022201442|nr:uncharacterized protein BYT42DRAFT_621730 [Radiomyces spectabilis]KAI8373050.1 hypothetical protein BYT42DRAFT_621730 [Radiomyces spectabilis]
MQFFDEDGKGRVVDEYEVEPMHLSVDKELFAIETKVLELSFYRTNLQRNLLSRSYITASGCR